MAKRYYKRLSQFPEGTDRLENEVRLPIDEDQIVRLLEEYFPGGNMKPMVGYIILRYGLWEEAMNIGMTAPQRIAFRATWALEWAYEQSLGQLPEWFFDRMADDFAASRNGSLHRVYAKMLADQMVFEGIRPTETQAEKLAEKSFELLIDPKTRGAVKAWCLEILFALRLRLDWIAEPMEDIVQRLSEAPDCSPGMRVWCRELSKRLKS